MFQGSCGHGKPGKFMEFEWLISRPGEVIKIFQNVKSHGKWKYTIKMTFWPNAKCDIHGNILIASDAHAMDPFCAQSWVLKGYGISVFYHRKVMEKSWNLKAQKEHEPWCSLWKNLKYQKLQLIHLFESLHFWKFPQIFQINLYFVIRLGGGNSTPWLK